MIKTLHLFPGLNEQLISLLRNLELPDWQKPVVGLWTVKDVAAHLLDGNIRGLSTSRDNYLGEEAAGINSYKDLVEFLNRLNADWVNAMKRVSPTVLIELLEITGRAYYEHLKGLDLEAPALFAVAWAGQEQSANWFHIAREYTEKWHHQQQIRDALGKNKIGEGIMKTEFFKPLMTTFFQALPFRYQEVKCNAGEAIHIKIKTEIGGEWSLRKNESAWQVLEEKSGHNIAQIEIEPETAWKLFCKGISTDEAKMASIITGNKALAKPFFYTLAVMA
jgi:hypothetical protein